MGHSPIRYPLVRVLAAELYWSPKAISNDKSP